MKKALIGLVVVIVVAIVIALVAGGPGGKAPAVGTALDAKNTVGVLAYENLDQMAAKAVTIMDGLPPSLKAQAPMLSADGIKGYLGFDPASAAAWSAAGIDPTAGLAVTVDARVRTGPNGVPVPMLVAKITDRDKLIAFGGKLGVPIGFEADQGGVTPATIAGKKFWMGERHGFSFLIDQRGGDGAALKAQFAAFLTADGPTLSKAAVYRDAFAMWVAVAACWDTAPLRPLATSSRGSSPWPRPTSSTTRIGFRRPVSGSPTTVYRAKWWPATKASPCSISSFGRRSGRSWLASCRPRAGQSFVPPPTSRSSSTVSLTSYRRPWPPSARPWG